MISTGINLVMTVIGFSVSTMFIVFVCTRLICARIQLNASRRSFPLASRSDLTTMERGLHGLEPVLVSNFPTKKYSDEFFSTVDDSQCTVCLADYNNEDILRILPHCGHAFHVTCIDIWLRQHSTCPVCRISLREVSEKKRSMQPPFGSALRPHRSLAAFNQHPRPCGIPGHSPNCMLPGHAFSSRTGGGTRMDSVREDCFVAENNEAQAGERAPSLDEGSRPSGRDKGSKPLESPSTV